VILDGRQAAEIRACTGKHLWMKVPPGQDKDLDEMARMGAIRWDEGQGWRATPEAARAAQEYFDRQFDQQGRQEIVLRVQTCGVRTLKKVADVVGYRP
jgi:hypothetical protein